MCFVLSALAFKDCLVIKILENLLKFSNIMVTLNIAVELKRIDLRLSLDVFGGILWSLAKVFFIL